MTLHDLALLIAAAVIFQLAILAGVLYLRHRRTFAELPDRVDTSARMADDVATPSAGNKAAWAGLRQFRVERRVIEDEAASICSFYLQPVDGNPLPDFQPGQYLTFHLTVDDPDTHRPKQIVRCYSLSDRPGQRHYRVSIKRIDSPEKSSDMHPGVSSSHFHRHVQEGSLLSVKAPAGHFYLHGGAADPIVLVGGGIGITPMLSMLWSSLEATPQREVWLFYAVRNGADHVFKAHLQEAAKKYANFHLHVCYSRPRTTDIQGVDYRHAGHVDVALLRHVLPLKTFDFYVCGPRAMLESLVPGLSDWGVGEQHIHYEAFGPASLSRQPAKSSTATTGAAPAMVTFAKSGKSLRWTGKDGSLLEFAENQGVTVDSGCRAGGCGTCQTKLVAGEVAYDHTPDFDVEPGCCLLCVAVPKTDVTLAA